MRARVAILSGAVAAIALAPVPALAREARTGPIMGQLGDPQTQRAMAGALAAMTEALLDIKVAPFAQAMDTMGDPEGNHRSRPIDPNTTLGDMAGPEARRMPREVARKLPQMMGAMGAMAGAMAAMLPQLEAMGEKMKDAMGRPSDDQGDEPFAGEAQEE